MATRTTVDNTAQSPSRPANDAAQPPQPPSPSHGSRLTVKHLRGMLRNEPAGVMVFSNRGWIPATTLAIAKFMAKLTGSQLVIQNLDNAPLH